MKVLTWNIGLFYWYKYSKHINIKLNGLKVENEFFHIGYKDFVVNFLREKNSDICVLQEFYSDRDREMFIAALLDIYPHHVFLSAWYHERCICVLSKSEIIVKKIPGTEFYTVESDGKRIIPVHLYSFSAEKRYKQMVELLENTNIQDIDVILGDTNLWSWGSYFLYNRDKEILKKIIQYFHKSKVLYTSKGFLNFDRIFINKKLTQVSQETYKVSRTGMDHYPVIAKFD